MTTMSRRGSRRVAFGSSKQNGAGNGSTWRMAWNSDSTTTIVGFDRQRGLRKPHVVEADTTIRTFQYDRLICIVGDYTPFLPLNFSFTLLHSKSTLISVCPTIERTSVTTIA